MQCMQHFQNVIIKGLYTQIIQISHEILIVQNKRNANFLCPLLYLENARSCLCAILQ